jgi:spore coat polysaccharide biosynthesis predicted glycosyltransferase SpsG
VNIKPKAVYITSSIPIKNFKKRKFKIIILNKIYNLDKYYKICDICIGSCGHSTWERAANLLPTISVELAQNQNLISKYIKKTNIGFVIKSKNQKEIEIFIVKKLKLIINVSYYKKIIKKLKKVITRNNLTQLVNKII